VTNEVTDPDFTPDPTATEAATERQLGALHGVVATALKTAIVSGGAEVSAAVLGAAITFLKNNNITASPTENAALADLNKALNKRRRQGFSAKAIEEASDQYARMNGQNGMIQ
jgi:hypothetical protein